VALNTIHQTIERTEISTISVSVSFRSFQCMGKILPVGEIVAQNSLVCLFDGV
jgi:hypothetical protein